MRNLAFLSCLRTIALVLISAVILRPNLASAFDLQGASFKGELELPDASGDLTRLNPNIEDVKDYFNYANCVCDAQVEFGIKVSLEMAPVSFAKSENVEFWTGTSCDATPENIIVRDQNCEWAGGVDDVDKLRTPVHLKVPVSSLVAANTECNPAESGNRSVYALIDEDATGISNQDISAIILDIPFDLEAPPAVTKISVSGAEQAIQIRWDLPASRADDIRYYQVLCARSDEVAMDPSTTTPLYLTSQMACRSDADNVHPVPGDVLTSTARRLATDGGAGTPDAGAPDAGAPDAGAPDAGAPDAGAPVSTLPDSLYNLNEATICGEASGTDTGVRVGGLNNGVEYRIVLLEIDNYRNVTALDLGLATPSAVEDGWEHYKNNGGHADGGYCFVATATYGNYNHPFVKILRVFRDDTLAQHAWGRAFIRWYYDNSPALAGFIEKHSIARAASYLALAPLVAFAAVLEYTGLAGKFALLLALGLGLHFRRQRRPRGAPPLVGEESPSRWEGKSSIPSRARKVLTAAGIALLLLGLSATAKAQPYWQDYDDPMQISAKVSHWNFGIKFGPYAPKVDDSASNGSKPFADVFGSDWKVMSVFSLDRFFAFPSGQLGITASLGFSNRSAKALAVDASGQSYQVDGKFVRSPGDSTGFRLMPTSLGVIYRFTRLDDDYGIPLVPYGKLSLAYYLWWFTDPNGSTSKQPTPSCPNPDAPASKCDGSLGRGGSLGYEATLGLAIRAERIDPETELSLRSELGIEHAGFFAELQLASVDGFGASDKLSVSDGTWFGGINFEF